MKRNKNIRLIYGTLLGVMTVILGALFIWQTLDIYFTGTSSNYEGTYIYSREDVIRRLTEISPAFWIWIVMIIVGFVLWEVFPVKEKRAKQDVRYSLYRLKKRIPADIDEGNLSLKYLKREEKILKILWLFVGLVCLAGTVYAIVYLSIKSNFSKVDVTHEMLNLVKNVMPWVLAAFVAACAVAVYEGKSAKRQLAYAKDLAGKQKVEAVHGKLYTVLHHKYFLLGVRIAVGCLGVALVIAGIFNDSVHDVLVKAINICTECIGLG